MINPYQLCEVLLFVRIKISDETNPTSKLSVADRTRQFGDALALAIAEHVSARLR